MLTVVKIGGALLNQQALLEQSLQAFLHLSGKKILVHGGGRTANEWMQKMNMQPNMVEGRRITDDATIAVVSLVYSGVNQQLVACLQAMGQNAIGLTGASEDCVRATIRPKEPIDFGWVGDIDASGVNANVFSGYVSHGIVPVMAPLTHDGAGHLLNTNADTLASVIAQAVSQHEDVRLVYLFEKIGVLLDVDDDESVITELRLTDFEQMKQTGQIHSGMIPKLQNGFAALKAGVKEVVICHPNALGSQQAGTTLVL